MKHIIWLVALCACVDAQGLPQVIADASRCMPKGQASICARDLLTPGRG